MFSADFGWRDHPYPDQTEGGVWRLLFLCCLCMCTVSCRVVDLCCTCTVHGPALDGDLHLYCTLYLIQVFCGWFDQTLRTTSNLGCKSCFAVCAASNFWVFGFMMHGQTKSLQLLYLNLYCTRSMHFCVAFGQKLVCQKWDLNACPHTWARTWVRSCCPWLNLEYIKTSNESLCINSSWTLMAQDNSGMLLAACPSLCWSKSEPEVDFWWHTLVWMLTLLLGCFFYPFFNFLLQERSAYMEYTKLQREVEYLTKLHVAHQFVSAEVYNVHVSGFT